MYANPAAAKAVSHWCLTSIHYIVGGWIFPSGRCLECTRVGLSALALACADLNIGLAVNGRFELCGMWLDMGVIVGMLGLPHTVPSCHLADSVVGVLTRWRFCTPGKAKGIERGGADYGNGVQTGRGSAGVRRVWGRRASGGSKVAWRMIVLDCSARTACP